MLELFDYVTCDFVDTSPDAIERVLATSALTQPGIAMVTSEQPKTQHKTWNGPCVRGDLPGPRSAELLARRSRRESNARVYPRRLPIAIADATGSLVRDLDGNVFIDFLTGAGALPLCRR